MKKILTLLSVVLLIFSIASSAGASILTFDDIVVPSPGWMDLAPGYADYGGLTWSGDWEVMTDGYFAANYKNSYNSPSGTNALYNGGDTNSTGYTITSVTPFDFLGASFSSFTYNNAYATYSDGSYSARTLTIKGYLNDVLVETINLNLGIGYTPYVDSSANLFDKLVLIDGASGYWLMDDFTYQGGAPVPEPATILLLGSGLIGLAGFGRKKLFKK